MHWTYLDSCQDTVEGQLLPLVRTLRERKTTVFACQPVALPGWDSERRMHTEVKGYTENTMT